MQNIGIVCVAFLFLYVGTTESKKAKIVHYNTDEHDTLGSEYSIPSNPQVDNPLRLPNGIHLTYGQIVALAGDFYGVPESPIVNVSVAAGERDVGRGQRFRAAFNTLAAKPKDEVEPRLNTLLQMIRDDHQVQTSGEGTLHTDEEWDEAVGGTWLIGVPVVQGEMLKLALKNFDHFQPQAKYAYLVGHKRAMTKAREASRASSASRKKNKMMVAYSMDAFAAHFLTDCFSAGHIRTPRVELQNDVFREDVGGLMAKYMHDEDCKFGLRVKNKRGDEWVAYGDKYLRRLANRKNHELAVEAVTKSINQVRDAYLNPDQKIDPKEVTKLLPFVDETKTNNSPLFKIVDGEVHRRQSLTDLQDDQYTRDWTSLNTHGHESEERSNSAIPE